MILRLIAPSFVFASCAVHLFCCGLPLLMSITNLGTIFGISAVSGMEYGWYESIEEHIQLISGIVLVATLVAHFISSKLDCFSQNDCCTEPCIPKKKKSFIMLYLATVLYVCNLALFHLAGM